ncbi:Uncharacterised protein [Mycobacteroides abscessus subsp. abscessus]|nr:Uncharacterised protein [Mycobacteroides abscessus subsp. abscessus]
MRVDSAISTVRTVGQWQYPDRAEVVSVVGQSVGAIRDGLIACLGQVHDAEDPPA